MSQKLDAIDIDEDPWLQGPDARAGIGEVAALGAECLQRVAQAQRARQFLEVVRPLPSFPFV